MTITPEILIEAYAAGVFPMAESRQARDVFWVDPQYRGIIPLDHFHVPRRLVRRLRQHPFLVRLDSAFGEVVASCAESRRGRTNTWINDTIINLYTELFSRGHAHSVECWENGTLVGGLYGIALKSAFFGESMFSRRTDASKIALAYLVAHLRAHHFTLLDTQFVTEHLAQFGAIEIPRAEYRARLAKALERPADFYGAAGGVAGVDLDGALESLLRQSTTQTS